MMTGAPRSAANFIGKPEAVVKVRESWYNDASGTVLVSLNTAVAIRHSATHKSARKVRRVFTLQGPPRSENRGFSRWIWH